MEVLEIGGPRPLLGSVCQYPVMREPSHSVNQLSITKNGCQSATAALYCPSRKRLRPSAVDERTVWLLPPQSSPANAAEEPNYSSGSHGPACIG